MEKDTGLRIMKSKKDFEKQNLSRRKTERKYKIRIEGNKETETTKAYDQINSLK